MTRFLTILERHFENEPSAHYFTLTEIMSNRFKEVPSNRQLGIIACINFFT